MRLTTANGEAIVLLGLLANLYISVTMIAYLSLISSLYEVVELPYHMFA